MDVGSWKTRMGKLTGRYKYAFLVLLLGIGLMCIPTKKEGPIVDKQIQEDQPEQKNLDQQLSEILSRIDGAGEVKVLLSEAKGEQILYQSDTTVSQDTNGSDTRSETILITDEDRRQSGLIHQKNPPVYQGAIVIAQGAGVPAVKLALTEAVSRITGLGADKISVHKMK